MIVDVVARLNRSQSRGFFVSSHNLRRDKQRALDAEVATVRREQRKQRRLQPTERIVPKAGHNERIKVENS
jgi:hypothetical protein